ncbi:subtilisin-like protease SBT1.7 [Malania oleifera]|uniref:subtilisin-like protease SBT1.7 n=1 Tax=Malania oleifera TaxID=397392 RepID=UPI0025AEBE27|nr:subtilisin-like protease SBT1.7 [Malania oleifera]
MKSFGCKFMLSIFVIVKLFQTYDGSEMKNQQQKATYIVHMDKSHMPASFSDHLQWYEASLKLVSESTKMLYTYNNVIHGFSTQLTTEEAKLLKGQPGVLSILPEVKYELLTTRTPEFLGITGNDTDHSSLPNCDAVSRVIIGLLDTGVWPESKSFSDNGLGPVPIGWKGQCETGPNFNSSSCNRKLIGARFFSKGFEASNQPRKSESISPRDDQGHGTHTASTAAGSMVAGANLFGNAPGRAQGMAKCARVAAYKVCWSDGCFSTDLLAAMDKAVEDGVHVMSLSFGGGAVEYFLDSVAQGSFGAVGQGVFVSCAAGNDGPDEGSVINVAPWMTTVGAGTLDRDFPVNVFLGNNNNFSGVSICSGRGLIDKLYPLVYAGKVNTSVDGNLCMKGGFAPGQLNGSIVVCDRGKNPRAQKGIVVREAGGVGMILVNEALNEDVLADAHLVPTAAVDQRTGDLIKNYINSTANPKAAILCRGTRLGVQPSPVVASFSSRGPNWITPKILKPDVIAPGVNIIAGWTGTIGPTGIEGDTRKVEFNIISGTSMSCPHVSGLAALVKAANPSWSPAAIRSALMTTAYTTYKNGGTVEDFTGSPSTSLELGAGHVNILSALDPGLVYDARAEDYLAFLCALNYNSYTIQLFSSAAKIANFKCDGSKKYNVEDLNYPSFSVHNEAYYRPEVFKYLRTVTNVGNSVATYKVSVSTQMGASVRISVEPDTLNFTQLNQKKNYTVTFNCNAMPYGTYGFASLEWTDGKHKVRSPITVLWV